MFTLRIWAADHTGGTKFYQVLSFHNGVSSFALHHYGAKGTFTDVGKISAGQCEAGETLAGATSAGDGKRIAKSKDGYTKSVRTDTKSFASLNELNQWVKDNFNPKAKGFVNKALSTLAWKDANIGSVDPASVPFQSPARKGFDAATKAHADWGSW